MSAVNHLSVKETQNRSLGRLDESREALESTSIYMLDAAAR